MGASRLRVGGGAERASTPKTAGPCTGDVSTCSATTKAEDATQDVFAKALRHWHDFRAESSPLTWLIRIATYHCLNVIRAERAPWHQRFERETRARGEGHGPQLFEDRESARKLLAQLDFETQQAAIHYFVDEITLDEVRGPRLVGRLRVSPRCGSSIRRPIVRTRSGKRR